MQDQKESSKERIILIVDDDQRNIFALSSYLEASGMQVHTAGNGFEALDKLTSHPEIEVVLMDMMMPGMDGYEAIGKIRQLHERADIPVIAVTARAMKGDREKCLEAGADEYVSKPVNLQELLTRIDQLLQ